VADAPERERYEVSVDREFAGYTMYRRRPGLIAFVHTEIAPRFEGRGLGSRLIAYALDDARRRELAVLRFLPVRARLHRGASGVRGARAGPVQGPVRALTRSATAGLLAAIVSAHSLVAALVAGGIAASASLAALMRYQGSTWKRSV
jgi:predicted GNAT family acetyltransferase